jgi:hypothetical protein
MKERSIKVLRRYSVILAIGIAYLIWVLITDIRIPCPVFSLTGLECPGCGITRMIAALSRLDFGAAYGYNPFILVTSPLILFCIIYPEVKYIKRGERTLGAFAFLPWVEIVLALAYAVVRNLPS